MNELPRVLIEDWLPIQELGDESRRERTISIAIPPLSRMHVWWARRPLAASAGVVLAGLLPSWNDDLKSELSSHLNGLSRETKHSLLNPRPFLLEKNRFTEPTLEWYKHWFLHLCGIWGDPVEARKKTDAAVASGVRIPNPYNYPQAYKNHLDQTHLDLLRFLLNRTWGVASPLVLDPTAGGGSIPFVSARLGFRTVANDLNGVAATIMQAGVANPARYANDLHTETRFWAEKLTQRIAKEMQPFFPSEDGEETEYYLFANAVACPRTKRLVPLAPDWWLRKKDGKEAAIKLVTQRDGELLDEVEFEVLHGDAARESMSQGTVSRGSGISPYDNLVIDAEYIKSEAQAGRMKQMLYAVAVRKKIGSKSERVFRSPTSQDREALRHAENYFHEIRDTWQREGYLPTEDFPDGNDQRPKNYGMSTWLDFFTPRQAVVHGTFGKEFKIIAEEVRKVHNPEAANAILGLVALLQGKALNYNSRLSSWTVGQQSIRSVFDRHDFSFKWTFAEYQGASGLYPWTMHVIDNAEANAELFAEMGTAALGESRMQRDVTVLCESAAHLPQIDSGSVTHICMDPPYYDNVMYAELSDYFYVWEKRTLSDVFPAFFKNDLADKDNEAVANPSRFINMGRRKNELATLDYEAKMTAIFTEARRILRDQGVLSVMFTHKRAEAWDTLGMGLLQAGFTIDTSWPVNTEAESSLHQANMNSAASTIMLVCRKRGNLNQESRTFLDDIETEIRQASREAATRFQDDGIEGVDLLLSTYGPTLSVISKHWPVYSSTPDEMGRDRLLRPEEALDLAREEVVRLRRQRIVGKAAQIDGYTDFVLLAWDIFAAREFPYDTARLLALAVGGHNVEDLERAKLVEKKSGSVRLLSPKERVRKDTDSQLPGVRPEARSFDSMIDAVDTALYIAEIDGVAAAKVFMDKVGLTTNTQFINTIQGLVNSIPRTKAKGDWVIPEAGLLNNLVTAFLSETVTLPAEVVIPETLPENVLF